jgi:hypoxanthine phosphoribosyltransferase
MLLGITRGGLIPCTLLAQRFEVRNILTATVIFYDDSGERFYGLLEPRTLMFPDTMLIEGKKILIVDDVFDSGRTARAVRLRCERARAALAHVAVLHYKPENNRFGPSEGPNFYAKEVSGSEWIVYPWERLSPKTNLK